MVTKFEEQLEKLITKIEGYKTYPSPRLKNTSVVYRNKDGKFTNKSKLSESDLDNKPLIMDENNYGELNKQFSDLSQKNSTILVGQDQENFNELLKTEECETFFKDIKNIFSESSEKVQDIGTHIADSLKSNLLSETKSFTSVNDHIVNSLANSPTINSEPLLNLTIGSSISSGINSLGLLTKSLSDNLLSSHNLKSWSISESLNNIGNSLSELLKDTTSLDIQNSVPDIFQPVLGFVHDRLISNKEKMEEINDLIKLNKEKYLSQVIPSDEFIEIMEDAGFKKINDFLKAKEKFDKEDLNLDKLIIHAVEEGDQEVPLSSRLKQFNNNDQTNKNRSWLRNYLKLEEEYGDQIIKLSKSNNNSEKEQAYNKFIDKFKKDKKGDYNFVDPKRNLSFIDEVNNKTVPMNDEKVIDFASRLLSLHPEALEKHSIIQNSIKVGDDIQKEVKDWISEISSLTNSVVKLLPVTTGNAGRDFAVDYESQGMKELTKKSDYDDELNKQENYYKSDALTMLIHTGTLGYTKEGYGNMNEQETIPDSKQDRVKSHTYHEFGHIIEMSNPDIHKDVKNFLFDRNKGNLINELEMGNGIQIDGGFIDSYTGRLYLNESKNKEIIDQLNEGKSVDELDLNIKKSDILNKTTEVVSIGTQHLSNPNDLQELASKDKDHLMFVLSMLNKK